MRREAFWTTAVELLRFRRQLLLALCGALVSAACFGAGLGMLLPVNALFFKSPDPTVTDPDQWHPLRDMVQTSLLDDPDNTWRYELGQQIYPLIPDSIFHAFIAVMAVIAVLTVIGSTGRYFHQLLTITVTLRTAMIWRDRLFRRLVYAPSSYFLRQDGSDHASRIVTDTNVLAQGHQALLGKAAAELLKGLAALTAAFLIDWKLTLLALTAAPIMGVLLNRFGRIIRKASQRALLGQASMFKTLNETLGALLVVKTHDAEGYERRRFRQINRHLFRQQMRMRRARALSSPVVETLALFGVIIAASVAAWYVFEQNVPAEHFLTTLICLGAAGVSIKPLADLHVQIREADAAANRLLDASRIDAEPILPDQRRQLPTLPRHHDTIVFDDVRFTFTGSDRPALDHVSLTVAHGMTMAIVGPNGAGKSTLLNLLPRLIDPQAGRVLIDGQDIQTVNLRSLRKQIAVVPQHSVLFEGTIADNIAYGRRHMPRERIEAAARAAFAHEFIEDTPEGYDRLLREGGTGLSGGQKQRLCIARAILRDPAILILDEATSQIDADSEHKINQALAEFRRGRTTFIIAHRLSTVIDADRIVVMDQGRIVDMGTHRDLLQRCDVYQMLTQTQLSEPAPVTD